MAAVLKRSAIWLKEDFYFFVSLAQLSASFGLIASDPDKQ